MWHARLLLPLLFVLLLAGCTTSAVILLAAWGTATDTRSVGEQLDDYTIASRIRTQLLRLDVRTLTSLDVFCHQGLVVIAGVVPPDSDLGRRAVEVARETPGVRHVESYFVPSRASLVRDAAMGGEILSLIIGDTALRVGQVDVTVVDGHAVVTGIVDSADKVDRIVALARTAEGVVDVRSFVQVRSVSAAVPSRPVASRAPDATEPPPAPAPPPPWPASVESQ